MEAVRLLPDEEERAWLVEETAELLRGAGWERYVSAVVVMPDAEYFPDRWTPDARGVRRLARRLLAYAGLGHLEVSVEVFQGDAEVGFDYAGRPSVMRHRGAAAWFAGIEGDVCLFGAEVHQLGDALSITAAMAHEVAHAFRRVHALEVDDVDEEERLTDLTTIYLGFGVLTTNATSRHRSGGGIGVHQWSHQSLGYLPPQAMSYLLALSAFVRGLKRREIAGALESNQAGFFRAAFKQLSSASTDVLDALGLPPRAHWPDPIPLDDLVAPIPDDAEDDEDDEPVEEPRDLGFNAGRVVFRVRRTKRVPRGFAGLMLGLGVALIAVRFFDAGVDAFMASCLFGTIAGLIAGGRARADHCSDPDCEHLLTSADRECPRCGGEVAGLINHARERLEAEERLRHPD